jgi:hypothetical protein
MFSGKCIVLCLFNLKLLDTWFTDLYWTIFSVVYFVFFFVLCCVTIFLLCIVSPLFLYCACSLFLYCATLTEVFPCFSLSCKANSRVN